MFDIVVKSKFEAGHCLRFYPEEPHNHTWHVTVTVRAQELDELGMGVDFCLLDRSLKEHLADLNGKDLNAHPAFAVMNTTAENVARYIFDAMRETLRAPRHALYSVAVTEAENCSVIYYGDD